MVLQLILTFSFFGRFIATLGLLLLDRLLRATDEALIAARQLFGLLILEHLELLLIVVDVLMDGIINHPDDLLIRLVSIFFEALANAKLTLQLSDLLAVLLLILDVALGATRNLSLLLLVLLLRLFDLLLEFEVLIIPLCQLHLLLVLPAIGGFVEARRNVIGGRRYRATADRS